MRALGSREIRLGVDADGPELAGGFRGELQGVMGDVLGNAVQFCVNFPGALTPAFCMAVSRVGISAFGLATVLML